MNELLRRALLQARLREDDVAASLGVDPKTVRRWLNGRIPYPDNRSALADLVGVHEADLWPDAGGPLTARARPEELVAIYPHLRSVPRDVWHAFFSSAEHEIGILAYNALFLAEDAGTLRILADKGRAGVAVRIVLSHPESPDAVEGGEVEDHADGMSVMVAKAVELFQGLRAWESVEIRLHHMILLNSIYRSDNQVMVSQHIFGIPAERSPVTSLRVTGSNDMTAAYLDSFERIWARAVKVS